MDAIYLPLGVVPRYTWDKTRRITVKLVGRMFLNLSLEGSGGDYVELV